MKNWKLEIGNWKLASFARKMLEHPLFSGSLVMIVGSNLTNLIAYIYHLILGRMLGPADYGILASTISLIGMFSVTFSFLGLVIVKFVSAENSENVGKILAWFNRKSLFGGFFLALAILLSTPAISRFLNIQPAIIFLVGPILFINLLAYVYKSFLQGLLKFKENVISSAVEFFFRLLIGVGLVYLGFSVLGAVIGVFLAALVGLGICFYFLKTYRIFSVKGELLEKRRVFAYAVPIFVVSLASNSLITTDLLLVKHFFDSHSAGLYAAMSNLGKIIFYGAAPVSAVMFPLISKRLSRGQGFRKIFVYSLLLTAAIAAGVLVIYGLFPKVAINVLYGVKYLQIESYLLIFGVVMSLFTISSLFVNYFLSREKTLPAYAVLLAAVGQAIGIWFYHGSISEVIRVSLIDISFLLAFLLIYFAYDSQKSR